MRLQSRFSMVFLGLCLCVIGGCEDEKSGGDPDATTDDGGGTDLPSEGSSPGECSDGADNDSDGDFDCNDSDCVGSPDCSETNTLGGCTDGADNDGTDDDDNDNDNGQRAALAKTRRRPRR